MLVNPDFEDDLHWWQTQYNSGAAATFSSTTNASESGSKSFRTNVSAIGPDPWNVQLMRQDFSLKKQHQYRMSFWAKADATGKVFNCSVLNPEGYSQIGATSVILSTSWQYFSYVFTSALSITGLLTFDFGAQTGTIWVDNTSLVDLTLNPGAKDEGMLEQKDIDNNFEILSYPNPFNRSVMLHESKGLLPLHLLLYNLNGKIVLNQMQFHQNFSLTLDNLPSGSYLLVATDNCGNTIEQKLVKQ
ncbi:MAG: carbohydrate binding domain-containing protein [Chitinophagales bacterium]|nr:carbohydrate binding domain-containing protein [Chitinophagales bacterium]